MTLKITSKPPRRKTKPTKTGWHSLTTDELLLWSYMFFERTGNSRFSEPVRQWAVRLHTTPSTIERNLRGLLAVHVVYPDKPAKAKDGWNKTMTYTVTEPPASVLRLAQAWWHVEVTRGKSRPSVPKTVHDETRINSGDTRVPKTEHITTIHEQYKRPSESEELFSKSMLSMDSIGVPKTVHDETRINSGDVRVSKSEHGGDVEKELLRLGEKIQQFKDDLVEFQRAADETMAKFGNDGGWSRSIAELQSGLAELQVRRSLLLKRLKEGQR